MYFSNEDTRYGDTYNCMVIYTDSQWERSWDERQCYSYDTSCPCSYPAQPILTLRGLCATEPLIDWLFSPKQLPGNPDNMILLGKISTRIEYNDTSSQWVLTDARSDVTAVSRATKLSYLLGKHCFDHPSRETAMLSRHFFRKSKFPSAALGKKLETKFPGFWNETGL